jgi:hypothetical protein
MQDDCNVVIYGASGAVLWTTGTSNAGVSPCRLMLQNSGVLAVIDSTDTVLWQNPELENDSII